MSTIPKKFIASATMPLVITVKDKDAARTIVNPCRKLKKGLLGFR
jgi:hypothetical protein